MSRAFLTILDMSITASIVILAVLLVRLPLKKAPKIFSYALWFVVLFRLLCPAVPASIWGIIPEQAQTLLENYEYAPDSTPTASSSAAGESAGSPLLTGEQGELSAVGSGPDRARSGGAALCAASYLWTAGVAGTLLYGLVSFIRLRRRLIGAVPLRDNIYLADHITSPFVLGLLRPKIYLPSSLSPDEREYIIQHEQHHIRRLDHVVKFLSFAALCVHWFNPLVWAAFLLMGRDMEMSCDEAVVKKLGEDIRADYSASLLSLATGRRIIAGTPLAFGEGDPKGRIKNLASWKKPAVCISVAAVIVVVLVIAVCGTNGKKESSWVKLAAADQGVGVEFTYNLPEPVRSWAIYEDIYEEGVLISSSPRLMDDFQEDGGSSARRETMCLTFTPVYEEEGFAGTLRCAYSCNGTSAKWELPLPKDHYAGMGMSPGGKASRYELEENGGILLYSIALNDDFSGVEAEASRNDTVVQYRFVTSTEGMEVFRDTAD